MLKNIYIKNIKGLRGEHNISFEPSVLKQSQLNPEKGVAEIGGVKVLTFPLLLANNASGKTTILEAIDFAKKWGTIENFIDSKIEKLLRRKFRTLERGLAIMLRDLIVRLMYRDGDDYKFYPIENPVEVFEPVRKEVNRFISKHEGFGFNIGIDEQSIHGLLEYFGEVSKRIKEVDFGVLQDFGGMINDDIVNFAEDFEITLVNLEDEKTTILSEALHNLIDNKRVQMLFDKYDDKAEQVTWLLSDIIHLLSEASNDSTGVYNDKKGRNELFHYFDNKDTSLSGIAELARTYGDTKKIRVDDTYKKQSIKLNDSEIRGRVGSRHSLANIIISDIQLEFGAKFLEKIIKVIDKNVSHVEVDKKVIKIVSNDNFNISADSLSFGTLKVLRVFHFIAKNKKMGNDVVLIDEIENGLNLSLINLIYVLASELNIQLIATTHNPLIADLEIIDYLNVFVNNGKTFIQARDTLKIKRPANLVSMLKPKNFYNQFHIASNNDGEFTNNTISNAQLNELLDIMEESLSA